MTTKPLVTILIPTYNRVSMLTDAIESAINQTYKNIEIIISDNHSEDSTEEICKRYAEKDSRIKYFRQNENIGLTNNSNFLSSQLTGEFFIWLCDDDWLDLDYVEKSVDFLIKHPDYSFVSPQTVLYTPNKKKIRTCDFVNLDDTRPEQRLVKFISKFTYANVATGVFRKIVIDEMYESDRIYYKGRYGDDSIFIIKYLFAGKGKILTNTHSNKREDGYTRDLYNTPQDVWDITGITLENFDAKLGEIFAGSIMNDKFYKLYCKNPAEMVPYVNKGIKNHMTLRSRKELIKYMLRHPLFLKRKDFYRYLKTYFKNVTESRYLF